MDDSNEYTPIEQAPMEQAPEPEPVAARQKVRTRGTLKFSARKYIALAVVLLVVGLGASIYLIPSGAEVATMQAKDTQAVDLGQVDVEAEYAQGRRTYAIVAALADKRIEAGDRPAAVKLLEEFVAANPGDVQGRKKLAEQYQLSGNQTGFNEQIEQIATAAPTEANLRMLSDIYNAAKEYPKQVDVLKKILDVTGGNNPQVFVDLATIQVVVGDSDGALKTVEELKAKHPTFSSYPMTRIMVSVLAEKGKVDEAFAAAKDWMQTTNAAVPAPVAPALPPVDGASPVAAAAQANDKPQDLADLCNILHYSGHADKAVELVDLYIDMLDREPQLVLAYVNASITAGQTDKAYAVLKRIDDSGTMIAALYPPYIDLTLKREDVAGAEVIANKLTPNTFTEEQALNTLEAARAHDAPTVLKILTTRFNDATIVADKPVLAAVIAIITNDKAQDTKIETALNTQLTSTQRIRLAESCARANKTACFDAIVKQYPPLEQMSPTQVAEYAQLFIIADRAKEIVDPVGKLASAPQAAADVMTAHRRLAAAAGRMDVLKPWLEANANSVPVNHLQELFYLANDRKHTEVSSDIAERLYARDPSPMNRDIMVSAYIGAGNYEKALPLLRDQLREPGANDGLYLSTLNKLARKDAAARKELAEYAQAALAANRGDDREKLNYIYILVNNGRKDDAVKHTKALADQGGAEWKKLYAQLTAKPKGGTGVKLSREQMIAMANNPKVSQANKRQMAFNLLNDGHKADALKIFKELAKNAGPDSQEVKDLMYLWGGKLDGEQLAWVQQRAATATAYDKQRWAELVNQSADDKSLVAYVSGAPDALYNPSLRKKYFRTLAGTGSRQNYEVAMRNWVAQTTDIPALIDYASVGQDSGYREAAINGYTRVLALDPSNAKALSQMAALDFSKGKYSDADQKLNHYIITQQRKPDPETDSAQAHFYKAQLLRREGKTAEAKAEFAYVTQLAAAQGASTPDALSRVYTSQFHLGQHAQAKAGFDQLLQQYPDDKGILADYMSALIEYNYLDEATRVANQYDKNSPYYGKGAAIVGRSANTASVQQLSGGREMKITFSQPIEGNPPIDMAAAQKLSWLEQGAVGYDSVTISAKPGYAVRYVPVANEQFAVVPVAQPNYSPQVEAQRQQDLRLQLLYARIEQNSGQTERAQQRLEALRQYYPNDPQLLSYKATVASARGDRAEAQTLIAQAQAAAPENEDLAYLEREFNRPAGSSGVGAPRGMQFAKADVEYRNYGAHDEVITTLSGAVRPTNNTELGVMFQHDRISPDGILVPSTGATSSRDANRSQGEIYAAYYLDNGDRLQASVFADDADAIGGGAYYAFSNALGRTELLGEYHKPYWDYPQAVYANANRDRVGFRHFATLSPKTTLGLESSVNNYNIEFEDDQVSTVLARASVTYQLQAQTENQPYFGVGYGFDGEYKIGDHETRTGPGGGYHPFDWRSREVHFLSGIYRDDWTPSTHALLVAGYAVDRLNEDGPSIEGRLTQDLSDKWELGARARYGVVTSNGSGSGGDDDAINVGTHLMYKF